MGDRSLTGLTEIARALNAALEDVVGNSGNAAASLQEIGRTHVPIYIFDAENQAILAANTAALRLYGYSLDEFLGLTLYDIRPPEEVGRTRHFLDGGLPQGLWHSGIWRHRTKEGRVFTVNALGLSIVREGRSAVLAIVTDMTQTMWSPDASAPPGSLNRPGFSRHFRAVGNTAVRTVPEKGRLHKSGGASGCRTSRCNRRHPGALLPGRDRSFAGCAPA